MAVLLLPQSKLVQELLVGIICQFTEAYGPLIVILEDLVSSLLLHLWHCAYVSRFVLLIVAPGV